jgi:hypothetical protein
MNETGATLRLLCPQWQAAGVARRRDADVRERTLRSSV